MLNDVCGIWEDWCINEKRNRLFPHVCISSFFAPMTKVLCLPRFVPTVNSSHSSKWVWLFWASQLAMDAWLALCVYVDFFQKQTADENLWTANLSSFFYFYSSFYLTESGHWYWLAFLPQSVNNDLAAADVGPRCQACDKHSCRSHIATWLSYFYWLPLKWDLISKSFSFHTRHHGQGLTLL